MQNACMYLVTRCSPACFIFFYDMDARHGCPFICWFKNSRSEFFAALSHDLKLCKLFDRLVHAAAAVGKTVPGSHAVPCVDVRPRSSL